MIFSQKHKIATVLGPSADGFDGDPATLCVNMQDYGHVAFILQVGATAGTGVAKVQVEKCTASDGTGATAMAFKYRKATGNDVGDALGDLTDATASTGFSTAASANDLYVIEVDARELGEGFTYVRLQLTETVDDPKDVCVTAVLSEPGFAGGSGVMPSVLS